MNLNDEGSVKVKEFTPLRSAIVVISRVGFLLINIYGIIKWNIEAKKKCGLAKE